MMSMSRAKLENKADKDFEIPLNQQKTEDLIYN